MIHGGGGIFCVWFQVVDYSHYYLEVVATWTHPIAWRARRGAYIIMSGGCQVIYGKKHKEFVFWDGGWSCIGIFHSCKFQDN